MNDTENLLDADLSVKQVKYAQLMRRAAGSLIDGLILCCFVLPLTYFNMLDWKNPGIYIGMSLISLLYKPFMEYQYGATLGKMAVKIKVVNYAYEKADMTNVLMRNIITILLAIVSVIMSVSIFYLPGFESIHDFMAYATFVNQNKTVNWINWITWIYYLIDVIFLLTDETKRTLHDRIGKTYVIMVEGD
jgi:uncharacterized RDD family membrane protein YckC